MQDGAIMVLINIKNSINVNNNDSNLPVALFSISSTSGKHHESNTDKEHVLLPGFVTLNRIILQQTGLQRTITQSKNL
jgi:hypothetical protein